MVGYSMLSNANQVLFILVALLSLINSTPLIMPTGSIRCSRLSNVCRDSLMISFRISTAAADKLAAILLYWLCFPFMAKSSMLICISSPFHLRCICALVRYAPCGSCLLMAIGANVDLMGYSLKYFIV